MAPKRTQTGASATTRRSTARSGARASSSSRTRSTASRTPKARTAAASPKRSKGFVGSWWLAPAAIVAALVLFAWLYYPVVRVQYRETRERARLENELTSLEQRNDRLKEQVDRLKTPEGVEDYARSQLGLVKAGENAVVVVDGTESANTTASPEIDSDRTSDDPVGPWTAFLDLVFGVR